MPNNSVEIVKNLQELAKKPNYEYEVYNKIFKSMQNADEVVLKEVVTFFLGLELEDLKKLKTFCDDLQSVNKIRQEQPGYGDGLILLWKQGARQILSEKIIPIVEKQESIKRIFAICEKLENLAMQNREVDDIYRYLNGEVLLCRNRDVFTIDDMKLIAGESYKTLFPNSNPSTVEFLHKVAKTIEDGEWEEKAKTLIQDFINNIVPPKCDGTISKPNFCSLLWSCCSDVSVS